MKKTPIIRLILGVIFLASAIFISAFSPNSELKNLHEGLPYTHSYTKAFCDLNNFCQDFEIFCKNKQIIEIRFTGAAVQFPEAWQDPRGAKAKSIDCLY